MIRSLSLPQSKGACMNKNRWVKRAAVSAGFFFLCAAPKLTRGQSGLPGPGQRPRPAASAARTKKAAGPLNDLAGLKFTPEQQAQIDQIEQDFKTRMDTVGKDDNLNKDQKDAMLQGLQRMESGEIFKVLTPEQQKEVRQKVLARRAAAKEEQEKQSPPK
jgi:Spy/CpxP family protein refolding chaperone